MDYITILSKASFPGPEEGGDENPVLQGGPQTVLEASDYGELFNRNRNVPDPVTALPREFAASLAAEKFFLGFLGDESAGTTVLVDGVSVTIEEIDGYFANDEPEYEHTEGGHPADLGQSIFPPERKINIKMLARIVSGAYRDERLVTTGHSYRFRLYSDVTVSIRVRGKDGETSERREYRQRCPSAWGIAR